MASALNCLVPGSNPGVGKVEKIFFSIFFGFVVWGVYVDFLVVGSNPGDGKVEIFWVLWLRKCSLNHIGQTVFVHR